MLAKRYGRKRRFNNRRYKRRTTYRRKRRYGTKRHLPVGVPSSMYAKLRYTDIRQASVAASTSDTREFRMNSLFDPDYTGAGGQPYYHDQYTAFFQRYRVYGCLVEWRVTCASSTSNMYYPLCVMTSYCDAVPAWSTSLTALNAKRSVMKQIIPGQTTVYLKRYYNLRSLAGVSKFEYNNTEVFQALVSANPSRGIFVNLAFVNDDGSNAVSYTSYTRLTFYCKYFDNAEPAPS